MAMTSNGLRTQFPYAPDAGLSPRPVYNVPSPSSAYPSGIAAASPGFFPMAYNISPRFGASAFIPSPHVFSDARRPTVRAHGEYTPRDSRKRNSEALNADPVALHLLLETAIGDSQSFDMLTVEEVGTLKQEQKALDVRLAAVRKKLEAETKIRDATRSLSRLASAKAEGHRRALSSKSSGSIHEYDPKEQAELEASSTKVEAYMRELLEIESRMRIIDMQLLMHTAAVLQITHRNPPKPNGDPDMEHRFGRPDSPASLNGYDSGHPNGGRAIGDFDERSYYRSAENLDMLMNALQNGTHHHTEDDAQASQAITIAARRLEEMNEKLRALIVQANPERDSEYALPPLALEGTPDATTLERQLDFLDQGLRNITAEQHGMSSQSKHSLAEVEGRLEGINNQLYAMLSSSNTEEAQKIQPPPPITGDGSTDQFNYLEDSFYSLEQMQYALNDRIGHLQENTGSSDNSGKAEKYESTLTGLWQIIKTGEDKARERKRERRRLLTEDSDAEEQLSPDEDFDANEAFSLPAFSAKVQWLFRRATTLKDKQSVLMRQIKQQRELNSKSDAQREAEFERLNSQVLSARSEKMSMEDELERAMMQLQQFDRAKGDVDTKVLQATQERNAGLEAQLINVKERIATFEAELKESRERAAAYEAQLKDVQERAVALQTKAEAAEQRSAQYEKELQDHQERSSTFNVQSREVEQRSTAYEAQVRDAQERALSLEQKLRQVQDEARTLEGKLQEAEEDARVEAIAIQAELSESESRIAKMADCLQAATAAKEAAEARSLDATNNLNAKEEEFRNLEGEIVRLTTELTFAKAELDGAYGTRAQRAAASAADPAIKREFDELTDKNQALLDELEALRKVQDAASQSEAEARQSERTLKAELSGMATEYEALTRDAIQNEKDRDALELQIDKLRDERENLERELSDEKVKMLGVRSPGMVNGTGATGTVQLDLGATSIRMLREDFRKMMRERTAEGLKALRAEQEERRKLEAVVRQLRKEAHPHRSNLSRNVTTATAAATATAQ